MLAGTITAVVVAAVLVWTAGGEVYAVLGYRDPGAVTVFGVNAARMVADVAAAVCVGSLVFAAFFTSPRESGGVCADGYAAVRTAEAAGWVWATAAAAMVPLEMSDSSGQPVADVLAPGSFSGMLHALIEPKAWLVTSAVALVVALSCHFVLSWRPTTLLAGVAVAGVLPPAVVGHSASNAGHDIATNAMLIHVVAAALWLGVLVAVVAHLRRNGARTALVLGRYRRLAFWCWTALAVSGVVDALVLVPLPQLLTTRYGALVLAKAGCLLVLGAVGVALRRRARGVRGLLGPELALVLVTAGVSAGMAHTPPPNLLARGVSPTAVVIGYDLPVPPSVLGVITTWRFDLVLGTAAVVMAVLYTVGVRRLHRRGDAWPAGRTVAWLAGCATVVVATSSGLGVYSSGLFSMHMLVHMVLNMLAPVLLVLGGPITLALRALPPSGRGNPAGPREWVLAVTHSPPARALANPAVATVLFVGSFYVLYFTPLFEWAMSQHWAHELMNAHFLLVGYLYYWPVIGVDPAPRPLPHLARLGVVFAVMPFHAFFGVIVMSKSTVIAENFYRTLDLPWAPDLLADQSLGGAIAWAGGELPLVIVLIALLTQWYRHDVRQGRRENRSGDEELAAYNAMLARLAESRRR
ncbi:bifunctional copper resistance protein CopD/cytochrome c oxidase assembly protein [Saccharopolyspora erythraea]|uniref:cytochrome c oxidase assembly protein n=1 Tax=Saccharopolyspora erythraea TaxID=1836 RepID=UPI001BA8A3EB|nr:cytochrome c oxidase assembly protein [Saccharopolyspora erythraea]QUH04999.1 bifunctional copper resistance protein CopD/cytochrome c oxidase assembly protein [Saccharopolyspora erythraea]